MFVLWEAQTNIGSQMKLKILKFEAQIQRTYLARCTPFTHWWIEDSENEAVVAGEKYN